MPDVQISSEEGLEIRAQAAPVVSALDDIFCAGDYPVLAHIQEHITELLLKGAMQQEPELAVCSDAQQRRSA